MRPLHLSPPGRAAKGREARNHFRNDRQQHIRREFAAEVQRVLAAENLRRPVQRIGVRERPDALHRIGRVRQRRVGAVDLVVLAAHRQRQAIALRHHDRGRPDLDVELDRLAGLQRPFLVVGVIRPIGLALLRIELAVRGAQPAEADRHARIVRADEGHLLAVRIEHAQHQEQVGVGGVRRDEQLGRDRAGDLHVLGHRLGRERDAFARRGIGQRRCVLGRRGVELPIRVQIKLGPLRARQRPFVLGAGDELSRRDGGSCSSTFGRFSQPLSMPFQETVEELPLQVLAVLRIEQREVRVAVHLQPFLLRARAQEALEIAARMQAHAAPVGGREQRRLDVLELRQPRLVVVVDQAVAQRVAVAIGAVLLQFVVGQVQRPRHRLAGDDALARRARRCRAARR